MLTRCHKEVGDHHHLPSTLTEPYPPPTEWRVGRVPETTWTLYRTTAELHVLLTVNPCIILLLSPTRCTVLLNIFTSLLYMFRASMCPSSRETYCIHATLVFCHSVWMPSGLLVGLKIQPADQTPSKQSDKIPVLHRHSKSLLMMGAWMPETCREEK